VAHRHRPGQHPPVPHLHHEGRGEGVPGRDRGAGRPRNLVDPRDGRTAVADWAGQWLARVRVEPGSREQYETRVHTSVLPLIGDRQLGQVRRAHLEQVLTQARERLAPSTVATTWRITVTMFRAAVRDGVISTSPCDGISVGRPPRKEVQVLDRGQLGALPAAARPQNRALLVPVVHTGLRQAEMFGLRRPRVDFLRRTLAVDGAGHGRGGPAECADVPVEDGRLTPPAAAARRGGRGAVGSSGRASGRGCAVHDRPGWAVAARVVERQRAEADAAAGRPARAAGVPRAAAHLRLAPDSPQSCI
jgi:integrase